MKGFGNLLEGYRRFRANRFETARDPTLDARRLPGSPYMLFTYGVRPEQARRIPACCHVDNTARVQTVSAETNPVFHMLLRAFEARTGVPVLINTSFNVRGEPIVCTPKDAIDAFHSTPLDALFIESFLLEKTEPSR